MIRTLRLFIERIASVSTLFASGIAAVTFVFVVNLADYTWTLPGFRHHTHGAGILDTEWHYSADRAYQLLTAQGENGRARYLQMLWTVDIALPLLASLWLAITASLALRRLGLSNHLATVLALLPLAAGLSDYIENSGITILLASYPRHLDALAGVLGYVTSIKHVLYILSLLMATLLWIGVLAGRRIHATASSGY